MSEHAKLSPSGADRWTTCTAALAACVGYKDESGPDAIKGTEAHALLERAIIEKTAPKTLDPKHHSIAAVQFAYEQVAHLLSDPKYTVLTEVKVQYSEDVWGTSDILIIAPDGKLIVIDYKNGVMSVPADCLQLLIYAAAALKTMAWLFSVPITEVGTMIIQPNGLDDEKVKEHTRTVGQVRREMSEKVDPACEVIAEGTDLEFVVSDKGCKWCAHGRAGNCEAFNNKALETVKSHFNDLNTLVIPDVEVVQGLTDEQVAQVIEGMPLFKKFLDAVVLRGVTTAKSGRKIPRHKLVAGRSSRSFTHGTEAETLEFLTKTLKFKRGDVVTEKVATPAAVEKLINALKRNKDAKLKLFSEAVLKEEGKLTLVHESSKKKEVVMFQELPAIDAGSVLG